MDFEQDRKIFLESFPGVKTFQLFDDSEKKDRKKARLFHCTDELPMPWILRLENLNEQKIGIFLCINETNGNGRTIQDIVKIRAFFVDLDGSPLEPVIEYTPSMTVESSPGKFHAYWFTDDTPLESFTTFQESLAELFKGDKAVKDLPRVMRIPGFFHMKGAPASMRGRPCPLKTTRGRSSCSTRRRPSRAPALK